MVAPELFVAGEFEAPGSIFRYLLYMVWLFFTCCFFLHHFADGAWVRVLEKYALKE